MKTKITFYPLSCIRGLLLMMTLTGVLCAQAQLTATVATPMGMGKDCGGSNNSYRVFNYNTSTQTLTNLNVCTPPSLKDPTTGAIFSPQSGSTAFDPVNQQVYYIETTTGNNSVIWNWTPGTCPTGPLAPVYTFSNDFVVGLDFNTVTGTGYQVEFSTGSAPYKVYLRQINSFSPPSFGPSVQITFPAGVTINTQNSDYVITPTGVMYLAIDNKLFTLPYSTYSSGVLNATYLGAMTFPNKAYVVGLAYANGNLIASITNNGTTCSYQQINVASGTIALTNVTAPPGTAGGTIFSSTDMATLITGVGAAKNVSSVQNVSGNLWQVQYNVKVRNYGNVNLTNVQVSDNLAAVFGSAFHGAGVAAVGTLPAGMAINPAFNGSTDTLLFAAGGTMVASPPDSAIVRVTVFLSNPNLNTTYYNSAIATATGTLFGEKVRDSSDYNAALNSDPDGNDVPDQAGEGIPTPLILSEWTVLANTLVDFNGEAGNDVNKLHWTLQDAQAGSTISVQRSGDGQQFVTLAQLAVDSTVSTLPFSWQDTHPGTGVDYYRLQLETTGGAKVYSEMLALHSIDPNSLLTVQPNPFSQSIQFGVPLTAATRVDYRILDMYAHVVQTGQLAGQAGPNLFWINGLGNIPAGIYILEVQAGTQRYTQKLIKIE